jgi:hypothetical protein
LNVRFAKTIPDVWFIASRSGRIEPNPALLRRTIEEFYRAAPSPIRANSELVAAVR